MLSLARDLRAFGFRATAKRTNRRIRFFARVAPVRGKTLRKMLRDLRHRQLGASAQFIKEMETRGILNLFVGGDELKIDKIDPRIHICENRNELDIYNYGRLLQAVPNAGRIGRQIRALVYDEAQDRPALMGAIGLASSLYTVGARDRYLGWSGGSVRSVKEAGLKHIMDLAVCISFPPYAELLGGKLMALLAMSDAIAQEHEQKYGNPLLTLFTTCATGTHCAIFNRIMIRKGGLYRRIGRTSGLTAVLYSSSTMRSARLLLERPQRRMRHGQLLPHLRPIRILKVAMRSCDISPDVLLSLGVCKGVYVGFLSENHLRFLRTGERPDAVEHLPVSSAVEYWRRVLLPKRVGRGDILDRIAQFQRNEIALSSQLPGT